ncbi:MAG: sulfotransferase domain-containing protein [Candidatus Aminicenantales bacterium]
MRVSYRGRFILLPDFLIVGAARSGTTFLYTQLAKHPDVFMPEEKEPSFLACWGQRPYYRIHNPPLEAAHIRTRLEDYLEIFSSAKKGQILGEASTLYLFRYRDVIGNIRTLYGHLAEKPRILILLRNPSERAWSHYSIKRVNGEEPLAFPQAIQPETIRSRLAQGFVPSYDYIGFGMYADAIRAYTETFPHTRVWIFEEFMKDPGKSMAEVAEFLGVSNVWTTSDFEKILASGKPAHPLAAIVDALVYKPNRIKAAVKHLLPWRARKRLKYRLPNLIFVREKMDPDIRENLMRLYEPDILKLEKFLGRNLSVWRNSP